MGAAAPIPPLLSLALGVAGVSAAPALAPPVGAFSLALGAVLCLHGMAGFRRGPRLDASALLRLSASLLLLLLPFWPALDLSRRLIAVSPDPRGLLWLSALYVVLLGWAWSLAPLIRRAAEPPCTPPSPGTAGASWFRELAWLAPGKELGSGLLLFALGFLWAALIEGWVGFSIPVALAIAAGVLAGSWLMVSGVMRKERDAPEELASRAATATRSPPTASEDSGLPLERRLYEAARQGRVEEALILLEAGADPLALPEPEDADQRSLIQIAVTLPDLRLLRALILRGVSVNELHGGITPLIAATRDSRAGRLEAVLTLLANGARLDAVDRERNQAVHHAARCENPAVIAALLDAGAPLDALNGEGMSPLGVALEAQCWATAEYLIKRGAALEPVGGCPAMVAAARGIQDDPTGIRMLLKAKARVDAADRLGRRALHHAALHGRVRMAEALLAAGADPNAQDSHGATPVMEAVRAGELKVLERLAFARPDLSRRDSLGRTALLIAVSSKHADPAICRLLLAMGADPREPGPDGRNALEQALALGRWSLVRLLDPAAPLPESLEAGAESQEGDAAPDPLALLLAALETGREAVAERLLGLPLAPAELAEIAVRLKSLRGFRWLCARGALGADTVLGDGRTLAEALCGADPLPWGKLAALPGILGALAGRGVLARLIEALPPGSREGERFLLALIESGADLFGAGLSGLSPLQAAIRAASLPIAEALLARGVDPNAPDPCGRPPLQVAVELQRGGAWYACLLRHGADPWRRDRVGETALGVAWEMGDREAVRWLHPSGFVWPGRPLRDSDMIAAARAGEIEALECLHRLGLSVEACDGQGASALLHAAGLGREAAVAWLLKHGADPNRLSENGASPLSAAIVGRSLPVLRRLLEAGADPERELAGGASALFVAAALGEADAARLLIGFGAQVDRCEERGRTALMVAAEALFRASLAGEDGEGLSAVIAVLIESGADVRRRSVRGDSALALLLGSRVQPGRAALEALLLPSLQRLILAGADLDAQDDRGVGPLHAGSIHGLTRAVALLLEHGADPERRDRLGRRPADLARLLGYVELCALFDRFRAQRSKDPSRRAQDEGLS
ncbi:MAG: hypothetical protein KatS3mg125_0237 [Lysobacterales bacterium]|jgi:ankyrin repeat protein|nr:MAG: hypothetical protein KatS3mg125_0237 [Xanthomonadales bacterium]